jgi:hypothetical protein
VPHLIAPHTALLSSSHAPEPAPTACLQSPPLCRRHPVASPPLHLRCGHPRHRHIPLSLLHPLRRPPVSCSPRWTEPPTWSTGHGLSLPIIQYKNNSVYSKEKPSLQRGPCFCLKSSRSPIKFQTTSLEFKSISRYNPSHFPKS